MEIRTQKRVFFGFISVLILGGIYSNSRKTDVNSSLNTDVKSSRSTDRLPMPPEVKAARDSFHKLSAALDIGISFSDFNRLLIETKTAVIAADSKLPAVVDPRIKKGEKVLGNSDIELQSGHQAMLDAMDLYKEAQFVWNTEIKGKHLRDTPEGFKIRWDHRFAASMTDPDIKQSLWESAGSKAVDFENGTNVYSQ